MLTNTFTIPVSKTGALTVAAGALAQSFVVPKDCDLVAFSVVTSAAAVGSALVFNVAKNGVAGQIATAQRPTIAVGAAKSVTVSAKDANAGVNNIAPTLTSPVALASFAAGDTVRVDVEAIGTTPSDYYAILEFKSK